MDNNSEFDQNTRPGTIADLPPFLGTFALLMQMNGARTEFSAPVFQSERMNKCIKCLTPMPKSQLDSRRYCPTCVPTVMGYKSVAGARRRMK